MSLTLEKTDVTNKAVLINSVNDGIAIFWDYESLLLAGKHLGMSKKDLQRKLEFDEVYDFFVDNLMPDDLGDLSEGWNK